MKPKTMILMVVAVACGLGASIMTSRLLADRKKEDAEPQVPVLVAKAKVPGWVPIKEPEKQFDVKLYPVSLAPRGAIGEVEKLKTTKLNKSVTEGHLLTEADLLSKEQQSIEAQLLPGQRATSIKVNAQSAVAGFVLPGSRVDIVMTTKGNNKASTKTILQHVLVMAVDNTSERNAETKSIMGQTVTVAATPEEAARLALAQSLGELQLHVKNPGETTRSRPVMITEADLDRPPLGNGVTPDEPKVEETPKLPTAALPMLPVEEKKPEEKVEVKEEKVQPIRRHVTRIWTGGSVEKKVFMIGEKDPDDDDFGSSTTEEKKPDEKKKVEVKKPVAPPAPPPAPTPAPATRGRPARSGR